MIIRHKHARNLLQLVSFSALLAGFALSACVGSSEGRRGGPAAAYSGPVVTFDGVTTPRIAGRGVITKKGGLKMAWSGTAATVHFKGTAVSVDMTDNGKNNYLVLIDGKPKREKITPDPGRSTTELIRGLRRGEHTVTLYKLNEPLVGTSELHAFILDDNGEALPPLEETRPRMEIIGDSISTGYGLEGENEKCGFSPETENHYLTYGARVARHFKADLTTIAWSGKGVFSNRGSTSDLATMSTLWTKSLPTEDVEYDFSGPAPEVVVINLGTNDFAPDVKDTSPFGAAYDKMLEDVRGKYPNSKIFVLLGPMMSDEYPEGKNALTKIRGLLTDIVKKRSAEGDENIRFLEFAAPTSDEGKGCDWHPSQKTHARTAATLVAAINQAGGF